MFFRGLVVSGFCGGSWCIILMWDSCIVRQLDDAMGQFAVSCKFQNVGDHRACMFSEVYGLHIASDQRLMWDELTGLHSWWEVPWCLKGISMWYASLLEKQVQQDILLRWLAFMSSLMLRA